MADAASLGRDGVPKSSEKAASFGSDNVPKCLTLDDVTQASEASQREVTAVVMSVLRMVAVGQKQHADALDDEHKTALRAIQKKASEAVDVTTKSSRTIQCYVSIQASARTAAGAVLRTSCHGLVQDLGKRRAQNALEGLAELEEATTMRCTAAMGASIAKWGELSDLLSDLRAGLEKSADQYADLIQEMEESVKHIKKISLLATCGLILVGIPVAAVCAIPAVAACIAALVGVTAAGALLTYGLERAKERARGRKETARATAAEAELKTKAIREAQAVLIEFADAVAKEMEFEQDFKNDLRDRMHDDIACDYPPDDTAEKKNYDRAACVWNEFKQCETAEEITNLALQLKERDEAQSLGECFHRDSTRFRVLQNKVTHWGNSLEDLRAKILTWDFGLAMSTE